jgi:hypothetical protein
LLVAFGVLVIGTMAVGLEMMKMTVFVAEGSGVSVGRVGVMVGVDVNVGRAAAVCVRATLAVKAMKVPIELGSIVGKAGAAVPGTQAITVTSAINQSRYFLVRVVMNPRAGW